MKTFKSTAVIVLLAFAAGNASAWELEGLNSEEVSACIPAAAAPRADAEALRTEAAADPSRFIDERTPEEVSLAFGLPANDGAEAFGFPARYRINNDLAKLATVQITIDLSAQRMRFTAPGSSATFKISSGLPPEHGTPGSGRCYAPDFIETMHYSSLYNSAPMPHSIFFNGNIAIHGTDAEWKLGQPASHGCIRLSKVNAKTLFGVVKAAGKANASICVTGQTPAPK
ncbi:MAG: L,D-transpeptidase [Elusimicrobiales bacterium]